MKLKGINPIEQHVEKVLVCVVTLIFLAVIGLQFVSGGNTIDVGAQQNVPIDRAYQEVGNLAQARLAQLQDENVDPSVPTEFDDPSAAIAQSWSSDEDTVASLPIPLGIPPMPLRAEDVATRGSEEGGLPRVLAVVPSAPTQPGVQNYAAAVDPLVVEGDPEIQAIAPAQQPYDMRSVTIASEFDAPALLEELRQDPDGAGPLQAVPGFWWQGGKIQIVDIEVERQVVYDNGEFGPAEIVAPMPGRMSLRDQFTQISVDGMPTLVQTARLNAREIIQPRFYRSVAGEPWAPPAEGAGNLAQQIDTLLRQLRAERARIEDLRNRLQQANADQEMRDILRKYFARQVSRGGGGGRGGAQRDDGQSDEQRQQQQQQRRIDTINKQIEDAEAKEASIVQQLRDLGFDPDTNEPPDPMAELANIPALISDGDTLRIWAHDLTAQPGVTYRYRMSVVVNNPLFSFAESIAEEDRDQAAEPFIKSDPSPWSEPIRVDDDVYWFVTRATPGGQQAIGRVSASATAEIYRFFYGYWRRAETRLQAGDVASTTLDLSAQALPIYTIVQGTGGLAAEEQFTTIEAPIPVQSDVIVLDVRTSAVSGGRRDESAEEVVFRKPDGALAVRSPDADLIDELRKRLESSASLGLSATVRRPVGADGAAEPAVADAPQPGQDTAGDRDQRDEGAGAGRPGGRGG